MSEAKKPRVFVEGQHVQLRAGLLEGFRAVFHYGRTQAELHILLAEPVSVHLGIPTTVRLELQSLIEALEAVEESDIVLGQAPRS
jgi:hypothetical protein